MNSDQRPDSFEVGDYTGVLRRRWLIVVGVTVLGLVGALGYLVTAHKTYTSTAQVFVQATGADAASQLANSRSSGTIDLDTEAQIVKSGTVAAIAAHLMHSTLSSYKLRGDISVTVPANSSVMDIACQAPSGQAAATCANDFAAAYLQNRTSQAKTYIADQESAVQAKLTSLQKSIASLNATISGLPSNSPTRLSAQAQLSSDNNQQSNLSSKLSTLDGYASQTNGGHVTTAASKPGSPSDPKKSLVLPSGIIVGLIVGLIAAFVWDRRDKRVHNTRDVERFFGLPVLLSLPKKSLGRQVSLASPRSRTGKAFTDLAHSVAASLGDGSHVVMVAGTSPGPGVSIVAANLAATLARTHSEAVLVCAALRDSVATGLFGLPDDSRGLAEVVAGRATVGEVARGPAGVPGLWVIPPGADTALAEYHLQHDTAKALTSQLRRDARFVVIEAQATDDGADTLSLAEFVDAAVLTVETQRTKRDDISTCITRLQRMRTSLLGMAVLPPVLPGISVRPPQPGQTRPGSGPGARPAAESGRDSSAMGQGPGSLSALGGGGSASQPDRQLLRPGRSADGYGDDRLPGN